MINNFLNKNGAINKSLRFLFFIILLQIPIFSQPITNLDKFYNLVDSASTFLIMDLGELKKVNLNLDLGNDFSVFANQIRGKIIRNGVELSNQNSESTQINFVIDNAQVNYSEPEKDGIFGDFLTERTINLSGNYFISGKSQINKFNLVDKDTIKVEDVEELENRSFPFTQGELPAEPFFSSILEPVVAITTAAVTVILFFSVRSK